jgi:hypothetical protein
VGNRGLGGGEIYLKLMGGRDLPSSLLSLLLPIND